MAAPKVVILGPAYPLRGGLATFNERLARAFQEREWEVVIYSFSLQYPAFLFPGSSQYTEGPPPTDLNIKVRVNSINPINWIRTGLQIKKEKPDLVLVRYWLPFMGPCFGSILRILKKWNQTRIICLVDNIIPHEKRPGDRLLTRYFLSTPDAFITMSETVDRDLRKFRPKAVSKVLEHPLIDSFGDPVNAAHARKRLNLPETGRIVLFFGFIRKYKGLDMLLDAFGSQLLKNSGIKLVVAGEFYDAATPYHNQIERHQLQDDVFLHTHYIPDSMIKYYFSAADVVVQPYKSATQSGVTPLCYHFEKPMIVTDVGGLAKMVPHEKVGLVCEPSAASIAEAILHFFNGDPDRYKKGILEEKTKLSWGVFVDTMVSLAQEIRKG
ncbi:MAG TPA: glycosyltransferase [Saprospiraceae bacterium]|nr:glycosyltransferase [Saprospiraceae bacterium]